MESYSEFVKALKSTGYTEKSSGVFSNGTFEFMLYGTGPYKIICYKLKTMKTVRGQDREFQSPCTIGEIYDELHPLLKEFFIYHFDACEKLMGWRIMETIGIANVNPKAVSKLNITY